MQLRPYQQEAKQAILKEWAGGVNKTLLVLPTGCHAAGEKILMANGNLINAEDIRPGDILCGSDGTPRNVLEVHSGEDEMFKVIPIKGKEFVVSANHPLTLIRTNLKSKPKYPSQQPNNSFVDVPVKEWISWSKYKKHIYKLIRCKHVKTFLGGKKILPISPYFLGILLGDGGLTTSINITTPDKEVVEYIKKEAQKYNMHLRKEPAGRASTYLFVSNDNSALGMKGSILHQQLKELGLRNLRSGDKYVPFIYKTSEINNRLEVIAGLIDSDGSLSCNGYDFISKSQRLSEDLAYMCRSVGLAAYVTKCKKSNQNGFTGTYYRVSISGDCTIIPNRVRHKKAKKRKQKKDVLRTGFAVESLGMGEYYGFTVDGDNRYLLDDFTITHNTGKTIVFSKLAEKRVRYGDRVLILAHRGELLEQAADKMAQATGLGCAVEKAEETCLDSWFRVVVGSVQSLMREERLNQFSQDFFDVVIVDEAHHALADSYQRVLNHFTDAKVLGVTATPDRGDMRNLGQYFESLAYEYTLPKAIKDGYLSPIKAQTIPLKLDLTAVRQQAGDFSTRDLGTALDPYLYQIADEMAKYCMDRRTLVFLPLIATSQKFTEILNSKGFDAAEVNGESKDRTEILTDFENGKYNVLCNSMLLTEGYDHPEIDCIVVLRPTKIRSLYSQMVGRGTRLHPDKDHLLLLDFLWHTERHELCHPAHLISENEEIARKMTENIEEAGCPIDLEEAQTQAQGDVIADREAALAKQLKEMRSRKRKLVDPLQFEMSIQAEDLSSYVPMFGWQMSPPSNSQLSALEKYGIFPDEVDNAGKASLLLDRLNIRRIEGLTTPKQIRFLESRGFNHVGTWDFDAASKLINRIAANGWRVPRNIVPSEYIPELIKPNTEKVIGW
ncbi:MAG TPA: DEAD/DEAH box helicase family protein [Clostridia bacterium]|nr:DEAD/DEAH box helicase family protein [Clostridia bacterium]